jgi:hypothetical protein
MTLPKGMEGGEMDNLDENRGREAAAAADVGACPVAEGDILTNSATPAVPKATTPVEAMANLTGLHDVYGYVGDINRVGYEELTRLCAEIKEKKPSALLVLATYGGDPDAGFRIARCLRHNYQRLTIIVPGFCKSAGTLICVGADDLVICDKGELGPLDIQINKPDEVDEFSSGLDITQSLNMLKDLVQNFFQDHMLAIRFKNNVSTKVATEIAAKLAIGSFSPIYGQIDPLRVGEIQRANQIVWHYATRLNEYGSILGQDPKFSLAKLVHSYPSHGFVIDRKEAKASFQKVRHPSHDEHLASSMMPLQQTSARKPSVQKFSSETIKGDPNGEQTGDGASAA